MGWWQRFLKALKGKGESPSSVTEKDIQQLIDIGEREGLLNEEEHDMITGVFEFKKTMVKEVMVPRTEIVAVSKETSLNDWISLVVEEGHSRVPVFVDTLDNIIGIVHVKDLFQFWGKPESAFHLDDILHPPHFIPESRRLEELLKDFKIWRVHIAIVVDEYGGTAGIVTIEDLIEEIFGEIEDEFDEVEQDPFQPQEDGSVLVDAGVEIDAFQAYFGLPEEKGQYETLSGLIFEITGRVPLPRERITYKNLSLIIEAADPKRIYKVRVLPPDASGSSPQGEGGVAN